MTIPKVGDVYYDLTITEVIKRNRGYSVVCKCKCGNVLKLYANQVLSGMNKSCGCRHKKHGMFGTRIYGIWAAMKARCDKSYTTFYDRYGGRGITYCEKWKTFEGFYEDMKDGYSDDLTLDRIDVDGNYEKNNCRWANTKTQMNNTSTNHRIEYEGKVYTLSEFAEEKGLDYKLFSSRILRGYSVEKAMQPVMKEKIEYKGETKYIVDFAKEYSLTYTQLKRRLMWGWDIERALTQPLRKSPKVEVK
jgi:hypothetical protein